MFVKLKPILVLAAAGLSFAAACKKAPEVAAAPPVAAADTIYTGGDIVTVNDARPAAEAVAVKDGKILAVGSRADIERANRGPATTVVINSRRAGIGF